MTVDVALGREVVHRLGHAIDVDRVVEVVLVDGPVAEGVLDSVDGDGTGIDHPRNPGPTGRFKHVVGAADVDLHGVMVPVLGVRGQQRGHVDDLMHLVGVDGFQQMGQLGHIAPVHFDAVQVGLQIGPGRGQVEADHIFAPVQELADDPVADEPRAAGDHHGHGSPSDIPSIPSVPATAGPVNHIGAG